MTKSQAMGLSAGCALILLAWLFLKSSSGSETVATNDYLDKDLIQTQAPNEIKPETELGKLGLEIYRYHHSIAEIMSRYVDGGNCPAGDEPEILHWSIGKVASLHEEYVAGIGASDNHDEQIEVSYYNYYIDKESQRAISLHGDLGELCPGLF